MARGTFAISLVFERVQTEGIAELSYLLGDVDEGVAAVFDPTPDVEKYVELAREKSVSITHIFETHIHADLMSGARELCARVDSAKDLREPRGRCAIRFCHGSAARWR
ncbi:MAG: MBL fold metallo-hydrolase [Chthoniobacterales bacterium]